MSKQVLELDTIHCGDCAEVMARWPDACIDLTVTSPPYGNIRAYKGYMFDFEAIAQQLYRVTRPGGIVVWIVDDETINGLSTGNSMKQGLFFLSLGFYLHDKMVYEKNGPAYPSRNRYYQVWEEMFILSKGKPTTVNLLKDRKNRWAGQKWSKKRTRRNRAGKLQTSNWDPNQGGEYGVRFNIWKYNVGHKYSASDKIAHQHPAIFPEMLARDHILSWSNPGDVVFDPMCGSGTTLKMAKETSRHWVGIDISVEYCELSQKRVDGAKVPLFAVSA